jgi:hypothetical protein
LTSAISADSLFIIVGIVVLVIVVLVVGLRFRGNRSKKD